MTRQVKEKERTINGQGITRRKLPTMQFVFNFDYSSQKELKTILMLMYEERESRKSL